MKILSIKKSSDFKKVNSSGNKFFSQSLILLSNKTPEEYQFDPKSSKNCLEFCRLGLTVSKKVGFAVTRNKTKRRLRHAAKEILPKFAQKNRDYVIIARPSIKDSNFDKIKSDLEFCIKRIDKVKKK